jgi:hypothetical protein
MPRPFRGRFWPKGVLYDVFDAAGALVARAVTAADAAATLGITVEQLEQGVMNWSYVDGGGYRATGHMQIAGATP